MKSFIPFWALAVAMGPSVAAPILSAALDVVDPDERVPPLGVVEAMLKTAAPGDVKGLSDCVKQEGLSSKSLRMFFRTVELPGPNAGEKVYFLRPALTPHCRTFYGPQRFRHWLVSERVSGGARKLSVVWRGMGESFEVLSTVSNGRHDIVETRCEALVCHARRLRFNGKAYQDHRCMRVVRDEKGGEASKDEPCAGAP